MLLLVVVAGRCCCRRGCVGWAAVLVHQALLHCLSKTNDLRKPRRLGCYACLKKDGVRVGWVAEKAFPLSVSNQGPFKAQQSTKVKRL